MKVYLAAYEQMCKSYDVRFDLDTNVFCTYYYSKHTDFTLDFLKKKGHKGLITIDSGAHSFFELMGISVTSKDTTKKADELPDPYEYFKKYLEWLKKWKDHFSYFVELDLQELVGQKQILEWREILKKEGLYHKCITVWHSYNSMSDYTHMIKDSQSKYVAIEGIRKGQPILDYNKFIKIAYENQTKIHGFALTRTSLLKKCPFYSVDSSSWTGAIRYGKIHVWDRRENKVKIVDSIPANFFKYNVPLALHSSFRGMANCKDKCEYSAKAYFGMQEYMTQLWERRGIFWKD